MGRLKELIVVVTVLALVACLPDILAGDKNRSKEEGKPADKKKPEEKNAGQTADPNRCETATFSAGCFWHVQLTFDQMPGVISTMVGYTGGRIKNPTYKQVCYDRTGHAEAVQIVYDPNQVSYEKLLEVFWGIHDPTTPNRQGPDVGSQYRAAVFYHNDGQRKAAIESKTKLAKSGKFKRPIVTRIEPASVFYKAEEYHQKYLEKQGVKSCRVPSG